MGYSRGMVTNGGTIQAYHIYLTSGDKVNIGDWGYINTDSHGVIGKVWHDNEYNTWDLITETGVNYPFGTREYIHKIEITTDNLPELDKPVESFLSDFANNPNIFKAHTYYERFNNRIIVYLNNHMQTIKNLT